MILHRLYELAVREKLLDDPAFEDQPVPFVVVLAGDGGYLGIEPRRDTITLPGKKGAAPKTAPGKGKVVAVPRPHGNTANQGFARYFADTLPRVLPVSDDEKSARSRATFWKQIEYAAGQTSDPALAAALVFAKATNEDPSLAARVRAEVEHLRPGASDRCTLAWYPDMGKTILDRPAVKDWYRDFFQQVSGRKQEAGPRGVCQVTGEVGPMPTTHPVRLGGIPGGLPTGVSVVSYDKPAFESYGLEGTANAGVGYRATEGYPRAVAALTQGKLAGSPRTSFRVGEVLFLFWTRLPADTGFMAPLDNPDPAQVQSLFEAAHKGRPDGASSDPNDFYLLCLSANAARAVVRDYLECPLPRAIDNLARWFRDIRVADATKDGVGKPSSRFPLWQLAVATALDFDRMSPDTPTRLFRSALTGDPVSESLLAAALGRLRAEGRDGFRPARMALVKLVLLRRDWPVTETLDDERSDPAYVCGRLLAVFEQIQYAALGDVNASVVDKFFGTFSAAPAMLLGRLYANAQNHLRKLRGDKPAAYVVLDRLLTETSAKLAAPPAGHLSLHEQGLFALGYYHQRAKRFEEMADRKARAASAAGTPAVTAAETPKT